eukprot:TRINITY_DN25596_c0_g1_i1.p1 TRINITY_DN25596_c0_g1~~TRINITY_DN25596_c0_g1_i1.p1  ORF type:complete len:420 (-),score=64.86 TRINITY_DN25596_c0_g1_i1:106-1365(-)
MSSDAEELSVLLNLNQRLFDADDKDVTFVLQDGKELAHKAVLRAASDVWAGMFDSNMREHAGTIEINDVTRRDMRVFLRALYTGQVDPSDWRIGTPPLDEEESLNQEVVPERECDAPADGRSRLKQDIEFLCTTASVAPGHPGLVLAAPSKGEPQQRVVEVWANIGMKSGRYFFEIKVVDCAVDGNQFVRVGFSCSEGENKSVGFTVPRRYYSQPDLSGKSTVVSVLLNLDSKSPNNNTISLFCGGVRAAAPKPIPREFIGKTLFPCLMFRDMTVQVNFGPEPLAKLPFKCSMLRDAALADLVVMKKSDQKVPLDILLPVAMLAKRYMVKGVLSRATEALKSRMTAAASKADVDAFEKIFAFVISADMATLRMACLLQAKHFSALKTKYEAGALRPEVQFELAAIWPIVEAPAKRLRFA